MSNTSKGAGEDHDGRVAGRNGSASPEQPLRIRKDVDRALILPLVGLVLLVPPVLGIFVIDARVAGLPFTAVYLFGVWGLLITGAGLLAGRLRHRDEPPSTQPTVGGPDPRSTAGGERDSTR